LFFLIFWAQVGFLLVREFSSKFHRREDGGNPSGSLLLSKKPTRLYGVRLVGLPERDM
jgi:hypothetical protein